MKLLKINYVCMLSIFLATSGCSRLPEQAVNFTFFSNTPIYQITDTSQPVFNEKLKPFIRPLMGECDDGNVTFEPHIYLRRFDNPQSEVVSIGNLEKITESTGIENFLNIKLSGEELEGKLNKTIKEWKPPSDALTPTITEVVNLPLLNQFISEKKPNVLIYLTDDSNFAKNFSKEKQDSLAGVIFIKKSENIQKDLFTALCKIPPLENKPLEVAYIFLSEKPACPTGEVGVPPNCTATSVPLVPVLPLQPASVPPPPVPEPDKRIPSTVPPKVDISKPSIPIPSQPSLPPKKKDDDESPSSIINRADTKSLIK